MGKKSRTKGHSYERATARKLRDVFPNAMRHLEYQTSEANKGIDLVNTGQLRIQCKRYKGYAPITKIFEVSGGEGEIPVLITKADRKPDMVVLSLDDFLKIIKDVGVVFYS